MSVYISFVTYFSDLCPLFCASFCLSDAYWIFGPQSLISCFRLCCVQYYYPPPPPPLLFTFQIPTSSLLLCTQFNKLGSVLYASVLLLIMNSWRKIGRHLLQIFLFVPRPPKNDLKMAEKQQNFERKFKFRSIKSYFFKKYGWI